MKKILIVFFIITFTLVSTLYLYSQNNVTDNKNIVSTNEIKKDTSSSNDYTKLAKYFAAALCIAAATFSSGIAVGKIGSAAMGAVSEKPEAAGTAMILAALAEGVCLWGIAGAFIILLF